MCKIKKLDYIDARFLNDDHIELLADVNYVLQGLDVKITIRKGFVSDGASIPRILWPIIGYPYASEYLEAALLHDALYASEFYVRAKCDKLFGRHLAELDVAWWRRESMFLAVWCCGWRVWRRHTAQSVSEARGFITIT